MNRLNRVANALVPDGQCFSAAVFPLSLSRTRSVREPMFALACARNANELLLCYPPEPKENQNRNKNKNEPTGAAAATFFLT